MGGAILPFLRYTLPTTRRVIMKFLGVILMGCLLGTAHGTESEFLTRKEVLSLLNQPEPLIEKSLDKGALEREKNLVPMVELLPPGEMLKLDSGLEKSLVTGVPKDAPKEVDLRHRSTVIKSQDNGKCTSYGLTAGLESTLQKDRLIPNLDLSEWHLWSYYRQYSAIAALGVFKNEKNRVGDEVDFPQYGVPKKSLQPHTRLVKSTYIGNDEGLMVKALMEGKVVYLAMSTPRQMLSCNKIINASTSFSNGGHAILIEGYILDEQRNPLGIIKNSWGSRCGDKGYQYMDMKVCHKSSGYCSMWVIDEVESNLLSGVPSKPGEVPKPSPAPLPRPELKQVCKRLWYAPWKTRCEYIPAS